VFQSSSIDSLGIKIVSDRDILDDDTADLTHSRPFIRRMIQGQCPPSVVPTSKEVDPYGDGGVKSESDDYPDSNLDGRINKASQRAASLIKSSQVVPFDGVNNVKVQIIHGAPTAKETLFDEGLIVPKPFLKINQVGNAEAIRDNSSEEGADKATDEEDNQNGGICLFESQRVASPMRDTQTVYEDL